MKSIINMNNEERLHLIRNLQQQIITLEVGLDKTKWYRFRYRYKLRKIIKNLEKKIEFIQNLIRCNIQI